MTHSLKHRGFGQSSRLALAVALAIPGAIALPVVAHAQEATQDYSIAGGDLGAALQRYSAASGVQLVYSSDLVAGKRSPGVSGRMSPQQALGQLLAGTGLSARVSGNTATLVQASASGDVAAAEGERLLGPVRVEGSQSGSYQSPVRGEGIAQLGGIRGGQDEEAVGYRAKVASAATGTPVAIEDIPRSISVQTQEQIDKQDITTIAKALDRMPGATLIQDENGNARVFVRDYDITSVQLDGGAPRSLGLYANGALNLDAYERVELVRGPNGVFSGENSVGGSLNLVRKRPGAEPVQAFTFGAGSFGRVNLSADTSTPSLFGSAVAFRGLVSLRREGFQYDHYSTRDSLIYGIFDIPLGDAARIEVGGQYNWTDINGAYRGLPRYAQGGLIDLPKNFNIFKEEPRRQYQRGEIFSKFYVDIAENWDFEGGISYSKDMERGRIGNARFTMLENGTTVRSGTLEINDLASSRPSQLSVDMKINGRFETFGLVHNAYAGFAFNEYKQGHISPRAQSCFYQFRTLEEYLEPNYSCSLLNASTPLVEINSNQSVGLVLGDTLSWNDTISVSAVFRRDSFRSQFANLSSFTLMPGGDPLIGTIDFSSYTKPSTIGAKWNPSYSILVKPWNRLSLFGSYATGFARNDSRFRMIENSSEQSFERLAPTTYENVELGAKYAASDWIASISAYRIKNKNVPLYNGLDICPPTLTSGGYISQCFETGSANQISEGIEFEISGQVVKGLSVSGNLNYNKSYFTGNLSGQIGSLENRSPVTSGGLYVDWTPAFNQHLSLRLGARYRARVYQSGTRRVYEGTRLVETLPFDFAEKAYSVFEAGIDYAFDNGMTLRLNVDNLTNKKYLSTVSSGTSGGNFYGRPRSFLATLSWKEAQSILGGNRSSRLVLFGDARDWYGAFDLGYQLKGSFKGVAEGKAIDNSSTVSWKHHLEGGAAGFARIGYYWTPRFRTELELQYRPSIIGDIDGSAVAPFGVCGILLSGDGGQPFQCDDLKGRARSYGAFGNMLIDLRDRNAKFVPYVGAGLGVLKDRLAYAGKLEGIGLDTPWTLDGSELEDAGRVTQEGIVADATSYSISWQLIGGFSYKLNDRLNIDASWRYIGSENMKWDTFNAGPDLTAPVPLLTPTLGTFSGNRRSHVVSLGVRWAFGARTE